MDIGSLLWWISVGRGSAKSRRYGVLIQGGSQGLILRNRQCKRGVEIRLGSSGYEAWLTRDMGLQVLEWGWKVMEIRGVRN